MVASLWALVLGCVNNSDMPGPRDESLIAEHDIAGTGAPPALLGLGMNANHLDFTTDDLAELAAVASELRLSGERLFVPTVLPGDLDLIDVQANSAIVSSRWGVPGGLAEFEFQIIQWRSGQGSGSALPRLLSDAAISYEADNRTVGWVQGRPIVEAVPGGSFETRIEIDGVGFFVSGRSHRCRSAECNMRTSWCIVDGCPAFSDDIVRAVIAGLQPYDLEL